MALLATVLRFPLSRFTSRVGGGSAFFFRRLHPYPMKKTQSMKLFFALMLVLSFVSAGYAYIGCVGYYAHNHYGQRSALLKTTEPPLGAHLNDALTPAELANTDEHFAIAYRASVSDGARLGAVSDIFRLQSIGVSGLLFLSSIFGLRLSTKKHVYGATNA